MKNKNSIFLEKLENLNQTKNEYNVKFSFSVENQEKVWIIIKIDWI